MEVWGNKGYLFEKRLLGTLGGVCYLGVQDGAAGAHGLVQRRVETVATGPAGLRPLRASSGCRECPLGCEELRPPPALALTASAAVHDSWSEREGSQGTCRQPLLFVVDTGDLTLLFGKPQLSAVSST